VGVITTLSHAIRLLNRNLWLLLFPLTLDVLLWVGPRVTAEPLVRAAETEYQEIARDIGPVGARVLASDNSEMSDVVFSELAQFNLLGFIVSPTPLFLSPFVPVELVASPLPAMFRGMEPSSGLVPSLELARGQQLVTFWLGLSILSLLFAALFWRFVAGAVHPSAAAVSVGNLWVRLGILYLFSAAFLLFLAFPLLVVTGLLGMLHASLGIAAGLAIWGLILWMRVTFFFVPGALLFHGSGVAAALAQSALLFQRAFWPTVGFVVLLRVISLTSSLVLQALLRHPVGVGLAVLGNAYIGTALAAAALLYYVEHAPRPIEPAKASFQQKEA
jgi:hypothetical protein